MSTQTTTTEAASGAEGFVLVPREPTPGMLKAAWDAYAAHEWDLGRAKRGPERESLPIAWRALLAAAPVTGTEGERSWLPMKDAPTGVPIIAKHKPNARMPHGWVATIKLGHRDDEEPGSLDTILHYNGDDFYRGFHGCWDGWLPVGAPLPAPQPAGAERVDLGELEGLSAKASQGDIIAEPYFDEHGGCYLMAGEIQIAAGLTEEDGAYFVALVNAHRAGHIVPASLPAALGSREGTAGASFGPGSRPSDQAASHLAGKAASIPSRGLSADEKLKQREALEDWLVQNASIGTWAARTTARALLLREDSPFADAACFAGHMTEAAALLDMVERHKLAVGPQCNGGWVIEGSNDGIDDAQEYDLARTRKGLRSALRLAASELEHPLPPPGALAGEAAQAAETEGLGSRASDGEAGTPKSLATLTASQEQDGEVRS